MEQLSILMLAVIVMRVIAFNFETQRFDIFFILIFIVDKELVLFFELSESGISELRIWFFYGVLAYAKNQEVSGE